MVPASLFLVVRPGAPSSFLFLVAMRFAPSSVHLETSLETSARICVDCLRAAALLAAARPQSHSERRARKVLKVLNDFFNFFLRTPRC